MPSQQRAFRAIYATQFWERFSYFGMKSLLVLYLVQVLDWSDTQAYTLFGTYGMLYCVMPVIGGYLTDQFVGYRLSAIYGAACICLGHLSLGLCCRENIEFGLSFICVGIGFLLPSLNSLVGEIYPASAQRAQAYQVLYLSVNVGGLIAGLSVGFLAHKFGWHIGFGIAAVGMLIGLCSFLRGWRAIQAFVQSSKAKASPHQVILVMTSLVAVCYYLLHQPSLAKGLVAMVTLLSVFLFSNIIKAKPAYKQRLNLLAILYGCSLLFFVLYEQSGTSMVLFTERVVDRHLGALLIPTPVISALNPLLVILFIPLMSLLWPLLAKRYAMPHVLTKFSMGLGLLSLGFLLLAHAGQQLAPSIFWLMGGISLMTLGELLIGPVMLNAIADLSPSAHRSTLMGVWCLMGAVASYGAAILAKLTSVTGNTIAPHLIYAGVFQSLAVNGLLAAVLILFFNFVIMPSLSAFQER